MSLSEANDRFRQSGCFAFVSSLIYKNDFKNNGYSPMITMRVISTNGQYRLVLLEDASASGIYVCKLQQFSLIAGHGTKRCRLSLACFGPGLRYY